MKTKKNEILTNQKPVLLLNHCPEHQESSTEMSDAKHLLDETEYDIQFIASGQGNIGQSEAEPNIIFYGRNQLDVGRGQVQ